MARSLLFGKGLSLTFLAVSLVMLGGVAVYLSSNSAVKTKSGASNVIETASGKLVKKGTAAFSPCKNVTTTYALIGSQPETPQNAKTKTVTPACTPLTVESALADPLLGRRVIASGTFQNGIFYATSLTEENPSTPVNSPASHPTPFLVRPTPETSKGTPPTRY